LVACISGRPQIFYKKFFIFFIFLFLLFIACGLPTFEHEKIGFCFGSSEIHLYEANSKA